MTGPIFQLFFNLPLFELNGAANSTYTMKILADLNFEHINNAPFKAPKKGTWLKHLCIT